MAGRLSRARPGVPLPLRPLLPLLGFLLAVSMKRGQALLACAFLLSIAVAGCTPALTRKPSRGLTPEIWLVFQGHLGGQLLPSYPP